MLREFIRRRHDLGRLGFLEAMLDYVVGGLGVLAVVGTRRGGDAVGGRGCSLAPRMDFIHVARPQRSLMSLVARVVWVRHRWVTACSQQDVAWDGLFKATRPALVPLRFQTIIVQQPVVPVLLSGILRSWSPDNIRAHAMGAQTKSGSFGLHIYVLGLIGYVHVRLI